MKKIILTCSAVALFACAGMAQQAATSKTKVLENSKATVEVVKKKNTPTITKTVTSNGTVKTTIAYKKSSEAYLAAKTDFFLKNPNPTKEQINQFRKEWD